MVMQARTYAPEKLLALLPMPARDAHKYSRGTIHIFAGGAHYPGAARLAATAAQRCGAGYTRVITESTNVAAIQAQHPSIVVRSWADFAPADLAATKPDRPCAYVVGCGFEPDSDPMARLALSVLEHAHAPVLVDGGALAAAASDRGRAIIQRRFLEGFPTILTPHEGEANRLAQAVQVKPARYADDAAAFAFALARAYDAHVVLKGPDTYIASGHSVALMSAGSAALAKAGTGDVLAGMIGALLAQGMDAQDAAVLGATLHAHAGCIAADRFTDICVTPEDLIDCIPAAIRLVAAAGDGSAGAAVRGEAADDAIAAGERADGRNEIRARHAMG